MELLKNGGSLSFIVPNSWLGIREAGALRKYLLKQGAIQEIVYYNFPVFEDPGVEAVRLLARKAVMLPSFSVSVTEDAEESRISSKATLISEEILNCPDAIIPIFVSAESLAVLKTIRSRTLRLDHPDSPFHALIALQAYATGKGSPPQTTQVVQAHAFHSREKIDSTFTPYLAGRDVERYRASWSGDYLSLGPWLAENPPLSRYLGPRVLIREVLGTPQRALKATYTDKPYLYNRSVLHVRSKSDNADQLLALLLLLNSILGSFLIKLAGKKSQRKLFPKVVLDDLKALPISSTLIDEPTSAAKLARQLLDQGSSAELEAAADQLIFDYYKLTTLQRESVRIALETAI